VGPSLVIRCFRKTPFCLKTGADCSASAISTGFLSRRPRIHGVTTAVASTATESEASLTTCNFSFSYHLSLPIDLVTRRVYRPRGINDLQILFRKHFQSIAELYESKYTRTSTT
jgi:hypothetical protein